MKSNVSENCSVTFLYGSYSNVHLQLARSFSPPVLMAVKASSLHFTIDLELPGDSATFHPDSKIRDHHTGSFLRYKVSCYLTVGISKPSTEYYNPSIAGDLALLPSGRDCIIFLRLLFCGQAFLISLYYPLQSLSGGAVVLPCFLALFLLTFWC